MLSFGWLGLRARARRPVRLGVAGVDGVCGWVADGQTYPETVGGKPTLIAASGVISARDPPPEGPIPHPATAPGASHGVR
jgi:hypothetical protein